MRDYTGRKVSLLRGALIVSGHCEKKISDERESQLRIAKCIEPRKTCYKRAAKHRLKMQFLRVHRKFQDIQDIHLSSMPYAH